MIDITRRIHEGMAIYPGNPPVVLKQLSAAGTGSYGLTEITIGSHTGTHIDAPSHIYADGKGSGSYSLEQMNGECEVIDLTHVENVIEAQDLPATTMPRVLIKTKNSDGDVNIFDPNFVALADSAAQELVKRGVKLVGLDALSIKKKGVKDQVHQLLLDAGIVIVEGLWLKDALAGRYDLLCAPLAVDLDGTPVRVALR